MCLVQSVQAAPIVVNDFSNLSGFTLNGASTGATDSFGNRVLRLTTNFSQSGSAFFTTPIVLEDSGGFQASFSTAFVFRFSDQATRFPPQTGADGIVFTVQTHSAKVGGLGGGIGYAGIRNSLSIEFDYWNKGDSDAFSDSHVGINLKGSVFSNPLVRTSSLRLPKLDSPNNFWHARLDYNRLEVRLYNSSARPTNPSLSSIVDLTSVLGESSVFVGFTSGTAAAATDHDIVQWQFSNTFAPITEIGEERQNNPASATPPEPSSLALLATRAFGFMGYGWRRKRKLGK